MGVAGGENMNEQPLRVSICEDDAAQAQFLARQVHAFASGARVETFARAEDMLLARGEMADILLLDIQMPGMDGVELARELRARGNRAQIIFVTGFADSMQAGYDVEAVHYLLKPVKPEKLLEVLARARERLEAGARMATLRVEGEWARLRVQDVLYAEARGHYAHIFLIDGRELRVKMALGDLADALGAGFFRCQRSFLVNMRRVVRVSATYLALEGGREIPLARGMREAAVRAFAGCN